jgi:molybdate transport system ATP-binding protein
MSALQLGLHVRRGTFTLAVDEQLPTEGIVALSGPSGAGKTTLLRALAGLERFAGGRVAYAGETWQDERTFVPPHRRGVGMVFQEARLFEHLTVADNLRYGLRRTPKAERRLDWAEVVETLDLSALLDQYPARLSGGEHQRVALGRALLAGPRLLLLDEPLSALDHARRTSILPFLARLPRRYRLPLVYVSHNLEELIQLGDHLVLLEGGRISGQGPLSEMLRRLDLSLGRREDAGVVVTAKIAGHDDRYHLTQLRFGDRRLSVSRLARPAGTPVRLHIHARDVSLTLQPPAATTILNLLPCRIIEIAPADDPAQVLIGLESAGQALLARITLKSCEQLGLRPGMSAYAQIKSVALTL